MNDRARGGFHVAVTMSCRMLFRMKALHGAQSDGSALCSATYAIANCWELVLCADIQCGMQEHQIGLDDHSDAIYRQRGI